jgi:hypothetical protein
MEPLYGDRNPNGHCNDITDRPLGLLMNYRYHQETDTSKEHDRQETQPDLPYRDQSAESLFKVACLGVFGTFWRVLLPKPLENVHFAAFVTIDPKYLEPCRRRFVQRAMLIGHIVLSIW